MAHAVDPVTRAVRIEIASGAQTIVDAADIVDPDNKHFHYFCADCHEKGNHVRLKFIKPAERDFTFERWDKHREEKLIDESGNVLTHKKTYFYPAHFDRHPAARPHRCDQDARYAAFHGTGYYYNAVKTGPYSYIFPVSLPGRGGWSDHGVIKAVDLRSTFRSAGIGLGGLQGAKGFKKLLAHFESDRGLQRFQLFHDGYKIRPFDEIFFESPKALHDYLQKENAVGRANAVIVAYACNPNTSSFARKDYPQGLVDRSMPILEDGRKLKLFAHGMNRVSDDALLKAGMQHGHFKPSPFLVFGEARLNQDNTNHIEIEFYNPEQVASYDKNTQFMPVVKTGMEGQMLLGL